MVSLEHIFKTYYAGGNPVPVLKDVNLSVGRGEFLGILGTSGSGKSTMLNILGMLDVPTAGVYQLEEVQVDLLTDAELATIRNRKIGFIFQGFNLFPHLTIEQNVEIPMLYGRVDRKVRRKRAHELIERVGLGHRFGHRPNQLSGGECQRVAIARALSNHPSFLLADEPTGNLDEKTGMEIMKLFHELNDSGVTIIMVTHNPDLDEHFDQIVHLRDGRIVHQEYRKK
ncbi:MAG: ABC transporter ATP-binding protein [Lentisphaeria bacterium]|nr:ABC transporter ATP-binding protein [Lentisphaerota bacterium]MBR7145630.1 ABC transporter ATP-binding protein [Lentisphaeria bacterium]